MIHPSPCHNDLTRVTVHGVAATAMPGQGPKPAAEKDCWCTVIVIPQSCTTNNLADELTMNHDYVARAFCTVGQNNPEFSLGMRGAYVTVACRSDSLCHAVNSISDELEENVLTVEGFDYIFVTHFIDRETSEYEKILISKLDEYPVQFNNIHYFIPDS